MLNISVSIHSISESSMSKWTTHTIKVSFTPDCITFRQWTDFWLKRSDLPTWFQDMDKMKPDELNSYVSGFDEAKVVEYMSCIATLVSCFCDKPQLVKYLPFRGTDKSLIALYAIILQSIGTYQPKIRYRFEHKNQHFVFSKPVIDTFGREWIGAELTTIEAIEALQAAHVLNAVDENGQYVLNDRKYHTDIALLAALTRKILPDGTIEQMPIETMAIKNFMDSRIQFFQDAPMSLALDISFFLKSSKLHYVNTRTSQLLMNLLQAA